MACSWPFRPCGVSSITICSPSRSATSLRTVVPSRSSEGSSTTTSCRASRPWTLRCWPSSGARRGRASPPWSTPSPARTSPSREFCGPRRSPPPWWPTRPTRCGSPGRRCCPAWPGPLDGVAASRAPCASSRPPPFLRGSPCWTPPTSTRSSRPTARSRRSSSRRPTSGCSSPRPPVTPTRCRGASCAAPASGARRWRWSSTGCRLRRSNR